MSKGPIDMTPAPLEIFLALLISIAFSGCLNHGAEDVPDYINECAPKYLAEIKVETPPPNTIFVGDVCFRPGELVIKNGTTVTFINDGNSQHSVIIQPWGTVGMWRAPDGSQNPIEFATDLRPEGTGRSAERENHTFNRVGHFQVWCGYHGKMIDGEATDMAMPNGIRVIE